MPTADWTSATAHVGILTRDLETAMAILSPMFELKWIRSPTPSAALVMTPSGLRRWNMPHTALSTEGPLRIELLQGDIGTVWSTERELEVHHVAYWVEDVSRSVAVLEKKGWTCEVAMVDGHSVPHTFAYMIMGGAVRTELRAVADRPATMRRLGSLTQ
jgi:hypothetical protein